MTIIWKDIPPLFPPLHGREQENPETNREEAWQGILTEQLRFIRDSEKWGSDVFDPLEHEINYFKRSSAPNPYRAEVGDLGGMFHFLWPDLNLGAPFDTYMSCHPREYEWRKQYSDHQILEQFETQLDNIYRYNGGFGHDRISVKDHSIFCFKLAKHFFPEHPAAWREALLHDVHEAVLGDVIYPVKKLIPWFDRLEHLTNARCKYFIFDSYCRKWSNLRSVGDLTGIDEIVKWCDKVAFQIEVEVLSEWPVTDRVGPDNSKDNQAACSGQIWERSRVGRDMIKNQFLTTPDKPPEFELAGTIRGQAYACFSDLPNSPTYGLSMFELFEMAAEEK